MLKKNWQYTLLKFINKFILYLILIIFSIFFIYPIFYAAGVTFMDKYQFGQNPPGVLPSPGPWSLRNLKYLLLLDSDAQFPVAYWYINSFVRSTWYLIFAVLSSLICGYVFSRLQFTGKKIIFGILMVTTLLPPVVTMTPTFLLLAKFPLIGGNNILGKGGTGFIDTYPALLLTGLFNIYGTLLVKLSIDRMPVAIEEAAIIDGANIFQILSKIIFPAQKPILTYIAITTIITIWNDWYAPYIYTNSNYLQTLASGINKVAHNYLGSHSIPDWPRVISLGFGMTMPCLIIFIFFQRYIVEGLTSSGLKG